MTFMPTLRIANVGLIASAAAALALFGCGCDLRMATPPPKAIVKQAPLADKSRAPRTHATTQFPAGNQRTRQFLTWAHEQYAVYCSMELDANGDCTQLDIHPCWPVKDEELKAVADLKQIQSLSCYASSLTDEGLRYLENLPSLKRLTIVGATQITDAGLERLKLVNPALEIASPYRKPQNQAIGP